MLFQNNLNALIKEVCGEWSVCNWFYALSYVPGSVFEILWPANDAGRINEDINSLCGGVATY